MSSENITEVTIQAELDIRDPLFVSISLFRGSPRLDVRHFYQNEANELAPTKKGINIPAADIPRLVETILMAYNQALGESYTLKSGE